MSEWKTELAQALKPKSKPQVGTCETQFAENMMAYGQQVARELANKLLDEGREYLNCRFGANSTQALEAQVEWASIVTDCGLANLPLLLAKDWAGYISAVVSCVFSKLIGGGLGGGSQGGIVNTPVNRCGGTQHHSV